jgi:TRAP-type C4-dicarboxylate transport system substrate-binding protein
MKQRKTSNILLSLMVASLLIFSAPVSSFAAEYEWTLSQPWTRPIANEVINKFAEDIKKATDGRIEVKVYADGLLGNHDETFHGVQDGSITMGMVAPYVNLVPGGILNWMPWTISSWEAAEIAFAPVDGPLSKITETAYNEVGMHTLFHISQGAYGLGNIVRPLRKKEDFKNLKMRVSGSTSFVRALQNMGEGTGMTVVTLPWSDLYSALSRGVVDGNWTMWPSLVDERHYEVLKYYSDLNFGWDNNSIVINKDIWEKLPEDLQSIVSKISAEAQAYSNKLHREAESGYIAKVKDSDCEVVVLTDEERAAFRKDSNMPAVWKELCDPWLEKHFPGQNMSEKIQQQLVDIEQKVLSTK